MNTAGTNRLLHIAGVALVVAGIGAVVAAVLWPMPEPAAGSATSDAAPGSRGAGDAVPLSSFTPAWSVDLRRPLKDFPQNATAVAVSPAGSGLPVRLVGTIFDPERPRGVFVTTLGQMELRAAGEKAGGVEVLKIDERSATLSIAGKPVTINIEKLETSLPTPPELAPPSVRSNAQSPAGDDLR